MFAEFLLWSILFQQSREQRYLGNELMVYFTPSVADLFRLACIYNMSRCDK